MTGDTFPIKFTVAAIKGRHRGGGKGTPLSDTSGSKEKRQPKSYLRGAVVSADGYQPIYLQLDPLPGIRYESVRTPRRSLKIR